MTHEEKNHHRHFQSQKENQGDGLLLTASHRTLNNSIGTENNMANKDVMQLSSSSSVESKVSFSPDDCSMSSRHHEGVIPGKNTRHHHLLYHSSYNSSPSSNSFSPPPHHEVPSSSSSASANPEGSKMYNPRHEKSRYTVDRVHQQRLFNIPAIFLLFFKTCFIFLPIFVLIF